MPYCGYHITAVSLRRIPDHSNRFYEVLSELGLAAVFVLSQENDRQMAADILSDVRLSDTKGEVSIESVLEVAKQLPEESTLLLVAPFEYFQQNAIDVELMNTWVLETAMFRGGVAKLVASENIHDESAKLTDAALVLKSRTRFFQELKKLVGSFCRRYQIGVIPEACPDKKQKRLKEFQRAEQHCTIRFTRQSMVSHRASPRYFS